MNREHGRNLLQCFHEETKNWETNSKDLFSKTLTRQILEEPYLKAVKIVCSDRQDLNFRQEHEVGTIAVVSVSVSDKLMLKDWNYRTHNTDMLNLYVN